MHSLFRPLGEVQNAVRNIASGDADLTRRLNTDIRTPFKSIHAIVDGFNAFMEKMQGMVQSLKRSGSQLDTSVAEMNSTVSRLGSDINSFKTEA